MAALGGSRHALINLSTQIDIPPIIKKSLSPATGYFGHKDEQSHHLNTFYVSFASVCALQMGAFCILQNFFQRNFCFRPAFEKVVCMDNGELEYVQNGNRRLIADTAIWDWYERAKTAVKPPAEQGG